MSLLTQRRAGPGDLPKDGKLSCVICGHRGFSADEKIYNEEYNKKVSIHDDASLYVQVSSWDLTATINRKRYASY